MTVYNPIRSAIRSPIFPLLGNRRPLPKYDLANSATDWYFAALGLAGTPWADVSRTGLGTRVDSAGLVGFGPHNLMLNSNPPDGSLAAGRGTITANLVTVTVSAYAYLSSTPAIPAGGTASAEFKAGTTSTVSIDTAGSSSADVAVFNVATGTVVSIGANNSSAIISLSSDGYYRCSVTRGAASAGFVYFGKVDATVGDTFYLRRCQVNQRQLTEYIPTTTSTRYLPRITHDPVTLSALGLLVEGQGTQLARRTEQFSNQATWARINVSVSENSSIAPDGTATADTITAASAADAFVFDDAGITFPAGAATWSVHLKRGSADFAVVSLWSGQGGAPGVNAWVNLQTKQFTTSNATAGYAFTACAVDILPNDWIRVSVSGTVPNLICYPSVRIVDSSGSFSSTNVAGKTLHIWGAQSIVSPTATSYIPNPGTGSAVRVADWAGPGVTLTGAALAAAFPGSLTQPFTQVIRYRKGYSVASNETLFALSAGSSAGGTNLLALRTNGTQAQLVTSAGAGALSGTLVHDGSTVNRIAVSVDPVGGRMSISVNGAAAVETTGIAYTGAGVAAFIFGSQTYAGAETVGAMVVDSRQAIGSSYITGAALQALSA